MLLAPTRTHSRPGELPPIHPAAQANASKRDVKDYGKAADGYGAEAKLQDKDELGISLLVKGQPQAFIDFFSLTHDTNTSAIKPASHEHPEETPPGNAACQVDSESLPVLSRQLIRAEGGKQRGDHRTIHDAYHNLGHHFQQVGNLSKALLFYRRSLQSARTGGYEQGEMSANLALGLVYQHMGDLEEAACCHERFLELSGDQDVQTDSNAAFTSLVQVYTKKAEEEEKQGHTEAAIDYLKRCMDFVEQVEDTVAMGHINHRLGVLHQQRGEYQKALHFHSNHLNMSRQIRDQGAEGQAYCGMAECYEALNDMPKAILSLETYLDISRMQDPEGQARACCNLGIIYYNQGKFEQSVTYFEKFFEVARTLGNQQVLDIARINLGVARGAARMNEYMLVVQDDLPALLHWKNNRMPFWEVA
ncbi:hypothetical protein BSKO_09585 [Bryopsis sp. KO-2023]|nr:hypothetical protein BSKO_09585 [Bryopsis sp. KO-2023]